MKKLAFLAVAGAAMIASSAFADNINRHPFPGDLPIAQAVEVPASATLIYISGTPPKPLSEEGETKKYGDTEQQTISVFEVIEKTLRDMSLEMSDLVVLHVFLVTPEGSDAMDFEGFMKGYSTFFGPGAEPSLPARSVVEVAGLAKPEWLVEIEAIAARPK